MEIFEGKTQEQKKILVTNAIKILEDILEKNEKSKKGPLIVFDMELIGCQKAHISSPNTRFLTQIMIKTHMQLENKKLAKSLIEQIKKEMNKSKPKTFEEMSDEVKNVIAFRVINNMLEELENENKNNCS